MTATPRPSMPAIIGKSSEFAITVDLDDSFGNEWLFGQIGYLIGGEVVGDYGLGTSLRDVLLQMHLIFNDAGKRNTPRFVGLDKEALFDTVWSTMYGDGKTGMEELAIEECWAKHDITIPVDVFAYVRVYQFDDGLNSRILWKSFVETEGGIVKEIIIPLGTTESVFRELRNLLEQLTEWEEAQRFPQSAT